MLISAEDGSATVGDFLYLLFGALALGLLLSSVRFVVFDWFLYIVTRLKAPSFDMAALRNPDTLSGFQKVIDNHYRYYQGY